MEPETERTRPVVITVGIQKGGTGKTSLAIALAGAWAMDGLRVGIADFDPQCNATRSLLAEDARTALTVHEVLWGRVRDGRMEEFGMDDIAVPSAASPQILVYPGSPEALRWETALIRHGRERLLRQAPAVLEARLPTGVDVLLIDTPPTLGAALQMALSVSEYVFIPTTPEKKALQGFTQLVETIEWIRARTNPDLQVAGIAVNRVRGSGTTLQREWTEALRRRYGEHVLSPLIPERTAMDEQSTLLKPLAFMARGDDDTADRVRELARAVGLRCGLYPAGVPDPDPVEV